MKSPSVETVKEKRSSPFTTTTIVFMVVAIVVFAGGLGFSLWWGSKE